MQFMGPDPNANPKISDPFLVFLLWVLGDCYNLQPVNDLHCCPCLILTFHKRDPLHSGPDHYSDTCSTHFINWAACWQGPVLLVDGWVYNLCPTGWWSTVQSHFKNKKVKIIIINTTKKKRSPEISLYIIDLN